MARNAGFVVVLLFFAVLSVASQDPSSQTTASSPNPTGQAWHGDGGPPSHGSHGDGPPPWVTESGQQGQQSNGSHGWGQGENNNNGNGQSWPSDGSPPTTSAASSTTSSSVVPDIFTTTPTPSVSPSDILNSYLQSQQGNPKSPSPPPPNQSHRNTIIIASVIVSTTVAILAIVAGVMFWDRRYQRRLNIFPSRKSPATAKVETKTLEGVTIDSRLQSPPEKSFSMKAHDVPSKTDVKRPAPSGPSLLRILYSRRAVTEDVEEEAGAGADPFADPPGRPSSESERLRIPSMNSSMVVGVSTPSSPVRGGSEEAGRLPRSLATRKKLALSFSSSGGKI